MNIHNPGSRRYYMFQFWLYTFLLGESRFQKHIPELNNFVFIGTDIKKATFC